MSTSIPSLLSSLWPASNVNGYKLGSPFGHTNIKFAFNPAFAGKNEIWKSLYTNNPNDDTLGIVHFNRDFRLPQTGFSKDIFSIKLRTRASIAPLFHLPPSKVTVTPTNCNSSRSFSHPKLLVPSLPLNTKPLLEFPNKTLLLWDIETFSSFLPVIHGTRFMENVPFLSVVQEINAPRTFSLSSIWYQDNPSNVKNTWFSIKTQLDQPTSIVVTYSNYEWVCLNDLLNTLEFQGLDVTQERIWLAKKQATSIDLYELVKCHPAFSSLPSKSIKTVARLFTIDPYNTLAIKDGLQASTLYTNAFLKGCQLSIKDREDLISYCQTDVAVMQPILEYFIKS